MLILLNYWQFNFWQKFTWRINKFEAEYDSNGNLIKLNLADEADKQNFIDIQIMMEGHKAALHKIELDRLELEAKVKTGTC